MYACILVVCVCVFFFFNQDMELFNNIFFVYYSLDSDDLEDDVHTDPEG